MGIVSSVRWIAISQFSRLASQLISVMVLSRLLTPDSYGLMAMAMTVTNFAFLFRDLGTSAAIIQRKEITNNLVSTVHWINIALGVTIGLILSLMAVPIASFFQTPILVAMILVLAISFPISSFGAVPQALLERKSNFKTLALIEITSAAAGLVIAVILALTGAGVWSLVIQMIFSIAYSTLFLYIFCQWRPMLSFNKSEFYKVIGYGGNLSLFRFVIYFEQNTDSMIIGRTLGAAALGTYAMAYKIMLFPLQNLTSVVSRALFPAFSRNQDSHEVLGSLYLRSVATICMITAPLMTGIFFLREELVLLVFGPQWVEIPNLLKWLAPVGFIQSLTASTGIVFMAKGRTRLLLCFGVFGAALQIAAVIIGTNWGIEGIAKCLFYANLINLLPCFCYAAALLDIAPITAILRITKPILASIAMFIILLTLNKAIMNIDSIMIVKFLFSVLLGAVSYFVVLFLVLRESFSDIKRLISFNRT